MKKVFITFLFLTFVIAAFSQQIPRERVIVEIGTGTWCPNCPGAVRGADDLVANGHDVAIIEYHNGDAYATTASNYRNSYYSVPGYPTATFGGVIQEVGGFYSGSMYSYYLPHYNTRIAVPCNYSASIFGQNTTGLTYDVSVVIDLEYGTPPADLTAHLILTESEIPENWQGMTELNYVCREMYPDHFGTTVDFAGGDQMIINYNFTLNASWDIQHIELVAFLQEESSKEILQGTMVPIENIVPFEATAGFSCSSTQPCASVPIDYIDESLGQIISWDWSFEGGTPATSTEQNPSVTYSATGEYDVELTVFDGTVYNTLLMENYIDAITTPLVSGTPSGPTELCDGIAGYTYTTSGANWSTDYTWEINPSSAGTIMGATTVATLDLDPNYVGLIDITVRGNNQCGDGEWSDAFQVEVFPHPLPFWISDGSTYCAGSQGVEVTLDGSETGVDYELYRDAVATGNIVNGTGDVISFGYQTTDGLYTISGNTGYCDATMYGNAYIYVVEAPGQSATPFGADAVCIGGTNDYSTNGAPDAELYVWTLDPPAAGVITGTTVDATVVWDAAYTGAATITVQGNNDCGDGVVSDPFAVTVEALPAPEISGEAYVYANTTHTYSSADHTGAAYDWTATGGTIASGQGTNEITVDWGGIGTGYVNLTETSAAECEGSATEYVVEIMPLGVEESFMTEINLYPNPAGESLNIELYSEKNANIQVQVVNQTGQILIDNVQAIHAGNNKTTLNTSDLPSGYYTLKMIADDGLFVHQKFVVMK